MGVAQPVSPREASAQVFVDDLDDPVLRSEQVHHLARVLRLRAGEHVVASDGAGAWRMCVTEGADRLEAVGPISVVAAPEQPVTIGFALVKGGKAELVVQKLTELGVDHIVAFHADRSVVRWDPQRAAKHLERLRRVAEEACAQCRRMRWPLVGWSDEPNAGTGAATGSPRSALDTVPDTASLLAAGAVLADGGGRSLRSTDHMVLVGPEGGWSDDELRGADRVELAPLVLRADTAAIAAGVLLGAARR